MGVIPPHGGHPAPAVAMSVRVCLSMRPPGRPGDGLILGQARTALYGWLYARHQGATLVLCVTEGGPPVVAGGGLEALCDDLRWLGLDWDRGPLPEAGEPPEPLQAGQESALWIAQGGGPPQAIGLPALVFSQGAGQESDALAAYRARGYLPLALANHLARLGWTPRGKRELLPLAELAARFDRQRVARAPVPFDLQQLHWFNRRALRALDAGEIAALLVPRWQRVYGGAAGIAERAAGTALTPDEWQRTLALVVHEELDCLDQGVARARFAFVDEVTPDEGAREVLSRPYAPEVLRAFVRELPAVEPFSYPEIDAWIGGLRQRFKAALGATQGVRSRDVMYVLRAALTGRMDGPCLVEVCQLLGQERCAARARAAQRAGQR